MKLVALASRLAFVLGRVMRSASDCVPLARRECVNAAWRGGSAANAPVDGSRAARRGGTGQRRFLDGPMNAVIGDLREPLVAFLREVGLPQHGAPVYEFAPEVTHGPLHLALGLRPVRPTGPDPKAKAEEFRVFDHAAARRGGDRSGMTPFI